MHISLLTASGKYNLWDELILLQEYRTLKNAYPEASFSIFTYDRASCLITDSANFITFFPHRAKTHPLKNIGYLWNNIRTIAKSDLVVIGGGGLIYDSETQRNMLPIKQWLARVFIAKLFHIPILWWAVGVNLRQEKHKKWLPDLFGRKQIVTVRDEKSQKTLKEAGIQSTILPDPVLSYEPDVATDRVEGEKTVGISLRTGYTPDEKVFFRAMTAYLRDSGYHIIFLSQSIHPEDTSANDALLAAQIVTESDVITLSLPETLEAYQHLDYVIGMRLHSLILATVHEIPFLALSYETKTRELLRELEYHHFIDSRTATFAEFKTAFEKLTSESEAVKFDLIQKNDTMKALGKQKTRELLERIDSFLVPKTHH